MSSRTPWQAYSEILGAWEGAVQEHDSCRKERPSQELSRDDTEESSRRIEAIERQCEADVDELICTAYDEFRQWLCDGKAVLLAARELERAAREQVATDESLAESEDRRAEEASSALANSETEQARLEHSLRWSGGTLVLMLAYIIAVLGVLFQGWAAPADLGPALLCALIAGVLLAALAPVVREEWNRLVTARAVVERTSAAHKSAVERAEEARTKRDACVPRETAAAERWAALGGWVERRLAARAEKHLHGAGLLLARSADQVLASGANRKLQESVTAMARERSRQGRLTAWHRVQEARLARSRERMDSLVHQAKCLASGSAGEDWARVVPESTGANVDCVVRIGMSDSFPACVSPGHTRLLVSKDRLHGLAHVAMNIAVRVALRSRDRVIVRVLDPEWLIGRVVTDVHPVFHKLPTEFSYSNELKGSCEALARVNDEFVARVAGSRDRPFLLLVAVLPDKRSSDRDYRGMRSQIAKLGREGFEVGVGIVELTSDQENLEGGCSFDGSILRAGDSALKVKVDAPCPIDEIAERLNSATQLPSESDGVHVNLTSVGGHEHRGLAFGHGEDVHAFVVGRPGKGKSTLLVYLITELCRRYSADRVRLFLVDCDGQAFKRFATNAPTHVTTVVQGGGPWGALALLGAFEAEMERRRALLKAHATAQTSDDLARAVPSLDMPHWILVIDEAHVWLANEALRTLVLERFNSIARTGRKYGLHVLFATQRLPPMSTSGLFQDAVRMCTQRVAVDAESAAELASVSEHQRAHIEAPGSTRSLWIARLDSPPIRVPSTVPKMDAMPELPSSAKRHAPTLIDYNVRPTVTDIRSRVVPGERRARGIAVGLWADQFEQTGLVVAWWSPEELAPDLFVVAAPAQLSALQDCYQATSVGITVEVRLGAPSADGCSSTVCILSERWGPWARTSAEPRARLLCRHDPSIVESMFPRSMAQRALAALEGGYGWLVSPAHANGRAVVLPVGA